MNQLEEIEALRKKIADLNAHNEKLIMRLVECGNATMGNMWGSAKNYRIDKTNQNWSAQYDMVCKVVDREIALRDENEKLKESLRYAIKESEAWAYECHGYENIDTEEMKLAKERAK